MDDYDITAENMYNWDEKGFLLGLAQKLKRIMTKKMYDSGKIKGAAQDGSREFISLLASICADGTKIPPALIYKGKSGDLQSTWLDDLQEKEHAFFASSANGWSSNAFGLAYLTQVFDPCTRAKAGRGRRLLIVDGHSSHVNMEFIRTCDRLKIILLILPPHSTHRLQPLDVGCFLPLSTNYTTEIEKVMEKSGGLTSLTKRSFWTAFKPAWDRAMSEENILSAWGKTGIWPTNPPVILDQIAPVRPDTPPETSPNAIATPYTAKTMRQFTRLHSKNPSKEAFRKLVKANVTNSALASIAEHRAAGLKEALVIEKSKRRRGKKLNLSGESSGKAQFFGTAEVLAAIQREQEKVEKAEQEKLEKEKAKEDAKIAKAVKDALAEQEKAIKAEEKEWERIRKAEQKEIDAQVRAERRERAKLDKAAAKKAVVKVKKAAKKSKPSRVVIVRRGSSKLSNMATQEAVLVEEVGTEQVKGVQTSRSGRQIVLPQRHRE